MHKQFAVIAVTGVVLAACSDPITPSSPARLAPVIEVSGNIQTQVVQDEYIVVLRTPPAGRAALLAELQSMQGISAVQVLEVYGTALNGLAIKASPGALTALRTNRNIEFVEPNGVARAIASQTPATWGIDRIDQRTLPLNNTYNYPTGGVPVHVYIIDTGIRMTHTQFTGRIGAAFDAVGGQNPPGNDCDGHGTHVAGTVGGTTYGANKTAVLHAVRVLDCTGSGTWAQVISGINHVAGNFIAPAVANMSIGGNSSAAVNTATNNLVAAGVVTAVAAGNDYGANACNVSPAGATSALTVGATTSTDARSNFSNIGTCLDIFAPGSAVVSAHNASNNATATFSGTSMASPHVAGAAALYRSFNPTHTPAQVASALISNATNNVVGNPGAGSPNRLLYMGFISGGPPPTNQNPVANFTVNCALRPDGIGNDCTYNGTGSTDADGTIASWNWTSSVRPALTGAIVSYPYPTGMSVTATLTVTDNAGGTGTKTQTFTVGGGPPQNLPPVANFTFTCVTRPDGIGADCTFNGSTSTDTDGTIVSYAWTAQGRPPRTGVTTSYPYPRGSTQTITLTVTDDDGATNTKSQAVTIP